MNRMIIYLSKTFDMLFTGINNVNLAFICSTENRGKYTTDIPAMMRTNLHHKNDYNVKTMF